MTAYSSFLFLVIALSFYAECNGDIGKPLFLTPLIECGKSAEARQKARVSHPELKNIESYAGFFTVNKKFNSNIFFWYFPSQSNPKNDPVVLWLEGGPGTSDMLSIFTGNGFASVNENNTLEFRKYYWSLNHNVIYVDNPVGSGFSFTEDDAGYATTEDDVARDLYSALTQFFDVFSDLRRNEFFITGQSYAGKYVPAIANEIKNKNVNARKKINLVGLAIGNGWTDPINQLDFSEYFYQIGLLDENGKNLYKAGENKIKDLVRREKYAEALEEGNALFGADNDNQTFRRLTGYSWTFNYLHSTADLDLASYDSWVQKPDTRRALHVGNQTFLWTSANAYIRLATTDNYKSLASIMPGLIESYKVLIYNGQLDLTCPHNLVVNYLRKLQWSGATDYKNAGRKQWLVGKDLAGYSKKARNLTELMIRNAGHLVTTDQPFWAWTMISKFTRHEAF